jgi:hypothetical protein
MIGDGGSDISFYGPPDTDVAWLDPTTWTASPSPHPTPDDEIVSAYIRVDLNNEQARLTPRESISPRRAR